MNGMRWNIMRFKWDDTTLIMNLLDILNETWDVTTILVYIKFKSYNKKEKKSYVTKIRPYKTYQN